MSPTAAYQVLSRFKAQKSFELYGLLKSLNAFQPPINSAKSHIPENIFIIQVDTENLSC